MTAYPASLFEVSVDVTREMGAWGRRPIGGMRVPLLALLWILLKAQLLSVEALGEETPALQGVGHALVTFPDPRGVKNTRKVIKWEMKGSHEEGWGEGSDRREK